MRIPTTPEIAYANVQLEADFIAKVNELRALRNNQINDVRCKRSEYKQQARREIQSLRHTWAMELAALRNDIEVLKDKRATLRQQFHDNVLERDNEELFELTSQIRKLQEHIAKRELIFNEKLNQVNANLQQALLDLGKVSNDIHTEFREKQTKLRQELAEKVDLNRQKAQQIARQEGLLS
jgi:hypothetical protein